MTQNVLDYSQNPSGAELMDTFLAGMAENQLTNHSGTSRPSYAQAGTFWIDTTTSPWVLKQFTGTNDIVIGTLDQTGLAFVARRALQDAGGNNIGETYLTKTGTAARALADGNGNVITSTYLTPAGTAARATADASGNNIANTYATKTELDQKSSFKLFHHDWFDYRLNDQDWLRADTFSWQNGTVYSNAYNHLVDDYNGSDKTPSITIVGGSFISDGTYFRDSTYDSDGKYAWNKTDSIIFTNSVTPSAGDNAYTNSTAPYKTDVISSYSSGGYTETIGSYTITYYLATDGHKIVLPDQETTVANVYTESGVAWYYILDTANQRFKLPRENPAREELIQVVRAKGNGISVGLTDGTTNYGIAPQANYWGIYASTSVYGASAGTGSSGYLSVNRALGITTDASKSGIISSMTDSTSVYKGKKYLYFYVGQFSQSATEQTAGLNSELFNAKADVEALDNKIQLVSTAPASQTNGILYVIPE